MDLVKNRSYRVFQDLAVTAKASRYGIDAGNIKALNDEGGGLEGG